MLVFLKIVRVDMGFILELGNVFDSLWISLRFNLLQITCFCTLGHELMDLLGLIQFEEKKMHL